MVLTLRVLIVLTESVDGSDNERVLIVLTESVDGADIESVDSADREC